MPARNPGDKMAFNPFDPADLDDPFAEMAALRRQAPISEPVPGIQFVARYDDVSVILRDHERFPQAGHTPLAERNIEDLGVGELDPPRHTEFRRVLLTALGTSKVRQATDALDTIVRRLVADFATNSDVDLMAALGKPFPALAIAHMIGIPESDGPRFRRWADQQVESVDPTRTTAADYRPEEFTAYLQNLITARRTAPEPPDDLVTRMINHVCEDGATFTDREIIAQMNNVIIGGTETTTHLIGNLVYELARNPDAYARLRSDRDLIGAAIDESLRLTPPVQFLFRRCPAEAALSGGTVPADATIAISLASANRDESHFANPDEFIIDRGAERHDQLGFGIGIHSCVGAQLTRLEVRLALEALLDAFTAIEFAPGFKYERVTFPMMRGPQRLDLRLQAAPS